VIGKGTEKFGGILGIGRKTKAVDITESLAGKSFDELEQLFLKGELEGKAKDLFEALQKIKQEGVDIDKLLADTRAQDVLAQVSEPQLSYQIVLDPVYIKNKSLTLTIGDLVWLADTKLQVNRRIRIITTTRGIVNEYQYQVELSDTVTAGKLDTIINAQATNGWYISSIERSLQNNSLLNICRLVISI